MRTRHGERCPMHKGKNIKLDGVVSDSGWKIKYQGRCITEWMREIRTDRTPESIIKELLDAGDYDGWTGVQFAKGLSSDDWLVFTSTWDSSD